MLNNRRFYEAKRALQGRFDNVVLWLFARTFNRQMGRLIGEAYHKSHINSFAMHWLCAFLDPTQRNPMRSWPFREPGRRPFDHACFDTTPAERLRA